VETCSIDGAVVGLRPIEADDVERLHRMFFRLSPAAVYLRFFSPIRTPSRSVLRHLATVDHDRRQAIVAVVDDEIVGVARYDADVAHPDRAEVAVVVEDAWQRHGLATGLLSRLADEARCHHVDVLTANVLGDNQPTMTLIRHLAPATTARIDHGEWLVEIPLDADQFSPAAVLARSNSPIT
jgi:GNAT superfamily N-acetyltransferase